MPPKVTRLRPPATRTIRKHEAILDAATRVFLRDGYSGASMDGIAAEAGVSKRTLYLHFRSKDALFAAIVRGACEEILAPIDVADLDADPEITLAKIGRQLMEIGCAPSIVALHRLVVAEAKRFPALARTYYRLGLDRIVDAFAAYLAEQARRGVLDVADPRRAAAQFFAMMSAHPHARLYLGIDKRLTEAELAADVALAVRTFLHGCRARLVRKELR